MIDPFAIAGSVVTSTSAVIVVATALLQLLLLLLQPLLLALGPLPLPLLGIPQLVLVQPKPAALGFFFLVLVVLVTDSRLMAVTHTLSHRRRIGNSPLALVLALVYNAELLVAASLLVLIVVIVVVYAAVIISQPPLSTTMIVPPATTTTARLHLQLHLLLCYGFSRGAVAAHADAIPALLLVQVGELIVVERVVRGCVKSYE